LVLYLYKTESDIKILNLLKNEFLDNKNKLNNKCCCGCGCGPL